MVVAVADVIHVPINPCLTTTMLPWVRVVGWVLMVTATPIQTASYLIMSQCQLTQTSDLEGYAILTTTIILMDHIISGEVLIYTSAIIIMGLVEQDLQAAHHIIMGGLVYMLVGPIFMQALSVLVLCQLEVFIIVSMNLYLLQVIIIQ